MSILSYSTERNWLALKINYILWIVFDIPFTFLTCYSSFPKILSNFREEEEIVRPIPVPSCHIPCPLQEWSTSTDIQRFTQFHSSKNKCFIKKMITQLQLNCWPYVQAISATSLHECNTFVLITWFLTFFVGPVITPLLLVLVYWPSYQL